LRAFFDSLTNQKLQWLPELGVGYYPVEEQPYDTAYWAKYRAMDQSPMGVALTQARIDLVAKHYSGPMIDIGIGGGAFVATRAQTSGFDINPNAVDWLKSRGLYAEVPARAVSFWDCLEHIHDPRDMLAKVGEWVFVSMPIYKDVQHVLRSKHYRKDEHCWYFTADGLGRFMGEMGFRLVDWNDDETRIGREDILSFVFRRMS
jgi:hypothetical protein